MPRLKLEIDEDGKPTVLVVDSRDDKSIVDRTLYGVETINIVVAADGVKALLTMGAIETSIDVNADLQMVDPNTGRLKLIKSIKFEDGTGYPIVDNTVKPGKRKLNFKRR